ncbi:rolling circle replication-associated protein, partial [Brevibacillus reuszeri]|uniref:rolling circle replication-associated protein n=1 Tax=Brevibacillus reuszeri TaxID=54915 RepID=UPI003F8D89E4
MNLNDDVIIMPDDLVTVTSMNHIIEIQHMAKMNTRSRIRKLDKHHYVDLETGEKKEFSLSVNRGENENSLRQTFKRLRYLINNNFVGKPNELHLIQTYAENMTDHNQLYKDFNKFIKRLKYKYKDKTTIDYISVVEPQGRGAWHCHVLMRFNDVESLFIPNAELRELWGHGFVTIKPLKDVDNIGAYLSAYLTDV